MTRQSRSVVFVRVLKHVTYAANSSILNEHRRTRSLAGDQLPHAANGCHPVLLRPHSAVEAVADPPHVRGL